MAAAIVQTFTLEEHEPLLKELWGLLNDAVCPVGALRGPDCLSQPWIASTAD